eukprot:TRINITY_DN3096_c0_g2_i2.p1 TRINITY_DN3096_c0_g2~~TRINITY_DN3096_c0_g2_i2.p1  ORF type:complete len:282 (+),score=56.89 TRINITY_DN3096_c0_g2_i2:177-1022(+)
MPSEITFQGIEAVKEATELERAGRYQESFELYTQGIDWLLVGYRDEKDRTAKRVLQKKLCEFMERAENVKHKIGRNIAGASLVYQNQPEQCQWRTLPEVPDTAEFRSASIEPPELHQEGAHAHVPHTRTQPLPNARQDTRLETLLAQTESFFKSLGKDQPQREEQPSEVHVPEVSVGEESVGEDTDRCPLCLENLYQNDEAVHRCLCGCRICLWCFEHQMSKGPEGKCPCCGCVVATELQGTEHDLDVIDERDLEDRGEESDASWDLMAEEVAEFEALSLL